MAAPVKLETKAEYEPRAQAVSLALALLRKAKASTWDDLMLRLQREEELAVKAVQTIAFDSWQMNLLNRNQQYLALVNTDSGVVPAFCTECGTLSLHGKGTAKKCINTRGCTGSMVKPSAATAKK